MFRVRLSTVVCRGYSHVKVLPQLRGKDGWRGNMIEIILNIFLAVMALYMLVLLVAFVHVLIEAIKDDREWRNRRG